MCVYQEHVSFAPSDSAGPAIVVIPAGRVQKADLWSMAPQWWCPKCKQKRQSSAFSTQPFQHNSAVFAAFSKPGCPRLTDTPPQNLQPSPLKTPHSIFRQLVVQLTTHNLLSKIFLRRLYVFSTWINQGVGICPPVRFLIKPSHWLNPDTIFTPPLSTPSARSPTSVHNGGTVIRSTARCTA